MVNMRRNFVKKPRKKAEPIRPFDSAEIAELIVKANRINSWYDITDKVKIENTRGDIDETEAIRRAVHTISNYYNTLGVFRDDFDKTETDLLSRNAYYVLCEKATLDYFSILDWDITDKSNDRVDRAYDFIDQPNPEDDFSTVQKMALGNTMKYDAGAIVKSFNRGGYLAEMKAYSGTEFWKEMDRVQFKIPIPYQTTNYVSYWSHGYTKRYWQRSATGLFIPYKPEEISYWMMYPRSDGIYGTDFMKFLKFQMQYLIDSTRAAGKTFENGIVPSLVWKHPDVYDRNSLYQKISKTEQNNLGSYRFGNVLHLVNNEDVSTLSNTLVDMEWLEGQRFVAQIIWAMWGFPANEFIESDTNRATAYVKRNITKSRMLYPIMRYIESRINKDILPYLKGYKKDWKFAYKPDLELDDQMKIAGINAQRAATYSTYINTGLSPSIAMKLAGIGDDLTTTERESVDEIINSPEFANSSITPELDGGKSEDGTEAGRYSGGDYVQFKFSDYGQGVKKENRDSGKNVEQEMSKGTVYVKDASEVPKGVNVRRGSRGGYYYDAGGKQQTSGESFTIRGGNVEIEISNRNGEIAVKMRDTPEAHAFMSRLRSNVKSNDYTAVAAEAKKLGSSGGLEVG
jgi:hypothetical protein